MSGLKNAFRRIMWAASKGTKVYLPMPVGAKTTISGAHVINPEINEWLKANCSNQWHFRVDTSVYRTEYAFERPQDAVMFKMAWG